MKNTSASDQIPPEISLHDGPLIDRRMIESYARMGDGVDLVRERHTMIHNDFYGARRDDLKAQIDSVQGQKGNYRQALASANAALEAITSTRFVADAHGAKSWSAGAITVFIINLLFMVGLMGAALFTISSYLIGSGINPMFIEHPWMACLVAGIPLGTPFVMNFLYSNLPDGRPKKVFVFVLCGMALLCMITFVILFSGIFGKVSQTSADIIAEVMETRGKTHIWAIPMVVSQILGELLFSSIFKLILHHMCHERRLLREYDKVRRDRDVEQQGHDRCSKALDSIRSEIESLDAKRAEFIAEAESIFHAIRKTISDYRRFTLGDKAD